MTPGPGDPERDGETRDHGEGFLERWSRRKRAATEAPPAAPVEAPAPEVPEDDERPRDPETGEPIDEELVASLPRIEEIEPGGDVSAFMRRGVPEALRREALRAMWTTDPAIRDFVSPALDYAYDYNAPGGAPGYGPLSESDIAHARELMASLFKEPAPKPAEPHALDGGNSGDKESQHAQVLATEPVRLGDAALQDRSDDQVAPQLTASAKDAEIGAKTHDAAFAGEVRRNMTDEGQSAQAGLDPELSRPRRRRGGAATPV